jgi:hypothetical protein
MTQSHNLSSHTVWYSEMLRPSRPPSPKGIGGSAVVTISYLRATLATVSCWVCPFVNIRICCSFLLWSSRRIKKTSATRFSLSWPAVMHSTWPFNDRPILMPVTNYIGEDVHVQKRDQSHPNMTPRTLKNRPIITTGTADFPVDFGGIPSRRRQQCPGYPLHHNYRGCI